LIARIRCWARGRGHNPARHHSGGFVCVDCNKTGASLEEMGFKDGGYVASLRRTYDREHGTFVRSHSWEGEPGKETR